MVLASHLALSEVVSLMLPFREHHQCMWHCTLGTIGSREIVNLTNREHHQCMWHCTLGTIGSREIVNLTNTTLLM